MGGRGGRRRKGRTLTWYSSHWKTVLKHVSSEYGKEIGRERVDARACTSGAYYSSSSSPSPATPPSQPRSLPRCNPASRLLPPLHISVVATSAEEEKEDAPVAPALIPKLASFVPLTLSLRGRNVPPAVAVLASDEVDELAVE